MWEEQGGKGGKDQGRKKDFAGGSQAGLCVNTTVVNTCFLITVRAHLCKQALIRTQAPHLQLPAPAVAPSYVFPLQSNDMKSGGFAAAHISAGPK